MEADLTKEIILQKSGVNPKKCMVCGKCSATCPNYDAMEYHPHQFVQMVENGDLEPLLQSKSIYACLSCFACLERCPRQVEPVHLLKASAVLIVLIQFRFLNILMMICHSRLLLVLSESTNVKE